MEMIKLFLKKEGEDGFLRRMILVCCKEGREDGAEAHVKGMGSPARVLYRCWTLSTRHMVCVCPVSYQLSEPCETVSESTV